MVYAILTQKQREQFENELELDTSHSIPGIGRFRVNVFLQRDSVGAVMRVIPFEIVPLEHARPAARRSPSSPTCPAASCSSPARPARASRRRWPRSIDIINSTKPVHIMTVEDPIEFLHKHKLAVVNQREVGEDTHSFADALKHVLRQDPDVILVGEMRDLETISTALTAAETGHLVFATLHTQDAPQSIDRIIDVFPAHQQQQVRVQLATSLQGIVTQQLVPARRRQGPRRSPPRCSSPRRRSATSSGRARPTRSTPPCRPAGSTACRRWTSRSPTWSRGRHDHHGDRPRALRQRRGPPPPRSARVRRARWPTPSPTRSATGRGSCSRARSRPTAPTLVANKLRADGLRARRHRARRPPSACSRSCTIPGFGGRVKLKDVAVFSRQFATMINSGLSLLRSLYILAEQTENKELATDRRRGAPGRREGRRRSRRRWPGTRRCSTGSTSPWSGPARPAVCSTPCCMQAGRRPSRSRSSCGARSSRR